MNNLVHSAEQENNKTIGIVLIVWQKLFNKKSGGNLLKTAARFFISKLKVS